MDDCEIVRLYFDRDELAIEQTDKKYGSRLMHLSARITESIPDSQECVSDTYLAVWKNIPPDRPEHFFAYLAKYAAEYRSECAKGGRHSSDVQQLLSSQASLRNVYRRAAMLSGKSNQHSLPKR